MTTDALARAISMLERLVAFDTESSLSNLPLIDAVEAYLREHDVPTLRTLNATGDKAALFATIGPMVDGGVVLSGHTDCVPVTGQAWTSDPFVLRRDGGRLFGRGACDMKGFDAVVLAMVPELKAARLTRPIHILLSYDEETTCLGPVDVIRRFGRDLPRPRCAIVGEPTMMRVADTQKSVATYRTVVTGLEAHSAKPALGANAIATACELVVELGRIGRALEAEGDPTGRYDPGYSTVHVGRIEGGTARNILARECWFHWEFRGLPGVPVDLAYRRFQDYANGPALAGLRRYQPVGGIETEVEVEVPGLVAEPGSAAEVLAKRLAGTNETIAVAYATEAGRFQGEGIPTVVCGPGSIDQAHQPDEYVEVSQIEACVAFMRALAAAD